MKKVATEETGKKKWTKLDTAIVSAFSLAIIIAASPIIMNIFNGDSSAEVKNAVRTSSMNTEQSFLSNGRVYSPFILNYVQSNPDIDLSVDLEKSNYQKFCVVGFSKKDPTIRYSYDSSMNGLLPSGQECVKISSKKTWANALKKTKILIVHAENPGQASTWKKKLEDIGFGQVDYQQNASILKYYDYDLVVAASGNEDIPKNVSENLRIAYSKGLPVFTEGKLNSEYNLPTIIKGTQFVSQKKPLEFNKTGMPSEPLFSYSFNSPHTKNSGDLTCITAPVDNSVAITTTTNPLDKKIECATSLVLSENSGKNRWVHMTFADDIAQNELVKMSALWSANIQQ